MEASNNTTNTDEEDNMRADAAKEFKFILMLVLLILLIFLAFFIYNLIKCYLPKWKKDALKYDVTQTSNNSRKIEFTEIENI